MRRFVAYSVLVGLVTACRGQGHERGATAERRPPPSRLPLCRHAHDSLALVCEGDHGRRRASALRVLNNLGALQGESLA